MRLRRVGWLVFLEALCLIALTGYLVGAAACFAALVLASAKLGLYALGLVLLVVLLTAWIEQEVKRIGREWT